MYMQGVWRHLCRCSLCRGEPSDGNRSQWQAVVEECVRRNPGKTWRSVSGVLYVSITCIYNVEPDLLSLLCEELPSREVLDARRESWWRVTHESRVECGPGVSGVRVVKCVCVSFHNMI